MANREVHYVGDFFSFDYRQCIFKHCTCLSGNNFVTVNDRKLPLVPTGRAGTQAQYGTSVALLVPTVAISNLHATCPVLAYISTV